MPGLALLALTVQVVAMSATPQLVVDTVADAALTCPAGAQLGRALRNRLPGVRVGGKRGGADDLTVTLRREIDHWTLALSRANGEALLVRELHHGRDDCSGLAESAALVIDRFLTDVHWAGLPSSLGPEDMAEPPLGPPAPPLLRGALFMAGPAVRAMRSESVDVGAYLGGRLLWRGPWFVGAEALSFTEHRTLVIADDALLGGRQLGSLVTRSTTSWVDAGVCTGDAVVGCLDLYAGASRLTVQPSGRDLHQQADLSLWRPVLGAGVALGYHLPYRMEVLLALRGLTVMSPPRLTIEGVGEAYRAPAFEWLMSVGLGRNFFSG